MMGKLVGKTGNSGICANVRNSVTTRMNIDENELLAASYLLLSSNPLGADLLVRFAAQVGFR